MKKIAVIGVYGVGDDFATGQATKCYALINWMKKKYGENDVRIVNTHQWKKNPLKLFCSLVAAMAACKNVTMLPAQHGLKVFAPLVYFLNKIFGRSVQYIVCGGWLAEALTEKPFLYRCVKDFDGIYVETKLLKDGLEKIGLTNVFLLPNSREYQGLPAAAAFDDEHLRACTYSRIIPEKGIADAIEILRIANARLKKEVFSLDVYGAIAPEYKDEFEALMEKNRDIAAYRGIKRPFETVDTLAGHFVLLFPTYYYGECFAGTVLDAFAAGVPIIANDWKSNSEVIDNGVNGLIYPFRDAGAAAELLLKLYGDKALYNDIRAACDQSARRYDTDVIMREYDSRLR